MLLERLIVHNCRIIKSAELAFSPDVNLICGDNGSGKSSVLEAVSILSKGRSFRTSRIADVIRNGEESLLVRANSSHADEHHTIGIERSKHETRIRVNQQDINTQAALSRYLPVTVIDPNSIELVTGSPSLRRAYIDWIAFYLFPDFHRIWQNYRRILKQRNLCLRIPAYHSALPQWTDELIRSQIQIAHFREKALAQLLPQLGELTSELLDGFELSLKLTTGFPQTVTDLSFEAQQATYLERQENDIKSARTSLGAHRADLQILFDGQLAQHCASRGQLKLIAIAMLLAQSRSIDIENKHRGIIAIDDLAAELDTVNKQQLLNCLRNLKQQLILTSTQADVIPLSAGDRMFHVKHGNLTSP